MSWREFATRFGLLTESTAGQVFVIVLSKSLTRLNCSNRLSQPDCNWCRLRLLFTFCLLCRGVFGHVFNFLIFWECKAWPSQLTSIHSSTPPRELWASGTKEFFRFLAINKKSAKNLFDSRTKTDARLWRASRRAKRARRMAKVEVEPVERTNN